MTRLDIIYNLKKYFSIEELVDRRTVETHGNDSWNFFNTDALAVLLIFREGINKPFYVNSWNWGGRYDERGLRTNVCDIVKGKTRRNQLYLSGHVLGCAFDFKVKGMSSDNVRQWALDNAELFPCKIRLENMILRTGRTISWVHVDVIQDENNPLVYLFNI